MSVQPCEWCGHGTKAADRVCPTCRYYAEHRDIHPTGLNGGHWEPRGLIQVWVPNGSRCPDVTQYIACPTCNAYVHEPCRTSTGRKRDDHATRLVSRRCACGAALEPRRRYCTPCARASHETAKRIHYEARRGVAA